MPAPMGFKRLSPGVYRGPDGSLVGRGARGGYNTIHGATQPVSPPRPMAPGTAFSPSKMMPNQAVHTLPSEPINQPYFQQQQSFRSVNDWQNLPRFGGGQFNPGSAASPDYRSSQATNLPGSYGQAPSTQGQLISGEGFGAPQMSNPMQGFPQGFNMQALIDALRRSGTNVSQ